MLVEYDFWRALVEFVVFLLLPLVFVVVVVVVVGVAVIALLVIMSSALVYDVSSFG